MLDQIGDPLDLGLDAGREVGEGAVGAEDHEQVRVVGVGHAQVAGRAAFPLVLDGQALAPAQVDFGVVAVHRIKAGGEDQHVEFVLHAVGGLDALVRDFGNRVGLHVHQ